MACIPFDIVGFDLDGTLLDTSGDLAAAVNYAIATDGRPPFPVEAIHPFVGKGAKVMLQRALDASGGYDEAMLARMLPILLDYYEQNLAIHSLPYPGLTAAMDALQAAGVKLAICTNKAERFTIPLLHQIGLSDRFASVVGGDTVGIAKPASWMGRWRNWKLTPSSTIMMICCPCWKAGRRDASSGEGRGDRNAADRPAPAT